MGFSSVLLRDLVGPDSVPIYVTRITRHAQPLAFTLPFGCSSVDSVTTTGLHLPCRFGSAVVVLYTVRFRPDHTVRLHYGSAFCLTLPTAFPTPMPLRISHIPAVLPSVPHTLVPLPFLYIRSFAHTFFGSYRLPFTVCYVLVDVRVARYGSRTTFTRLRTLRTRGLFAPTFPITPLV